MYVISVAPITEGIPRDELTYFSKNEVDIGDLVEVEIRKRKIKALVIRTSDVKNEKQNLRQADFGIKKISRVILKNYITKNLLEALSLSSSLNLVPLGQFIDDFIPSRLLHGKTIQFKQSVFQNDFDHLLLQNNYSDRLTRYKSIIRESFAKKQSLVIYFPTITDIEHAEKELSRGIDDYVVKIHSALTDKQFSQEISKLTKEKHPLLIFSTPSISPFVRDDIGTIITEREHSSYYYTHGTRGYDTRNTLFLIAQKLKIKYIVGSHLLSLNAHLSLRKREANELTPLYYRNDTPIHVTSMQGEEKTASPYLSQRALKLLRDMMMTKRGHYFLYAHRKGMYPTTICSDCGSLFICHKCNKPYVLHKIAGIRTFVCHNCEDLIRVNEDKTITCHTCGGWRLETFGIATSGVEEELERLNIPLFCIDGERTPTRNKIKKVYQSFKESPYGILIGTEMAHNIIEKCDNIIIMSLDSLFSLPEYRTDEKILTLVTEMAEKIKDDGELILQTRISKSPVMHYFESHSFMEFYKEELQQRETSFLPPFYVIIKATFDNLQNNLRKKIETECAPYHINWFEAGRGQTFLFIHIDNDTWINDENLRMKIRTILDCGHPTVNPLSFFT